MCPASKRSWTACQRAARRARTSKLYCLARLIGVHVRTLHAAAKDGRLRVTYDTRTTFRRLRSRATLADAETFRHAYFDRAVWPEERPAPLTWSQIPPDYANQIRRVRQQLGLTQTQLAARVGAARKASTNGNLASAVRRRCSGSGYRSSAPRAAISKHFATYRD